MKTRIFNILMLIFALLQFISIGSFAQITTNELPFSFLNKGIDPTRNVFELKVPDMKKIQEEDAIKDSNGGLQRIAVAIPVSINTEQNGEWIKFSDGLSLWRIIISAKDAKSLDFTFDKFWLPKGGKFYIYNQDTKESIGAITSDYLQGSKNKPAPFSTGIVVGKQITLEYHQPQGVIDKPIININRVYYGIDMLINTNLVIWEIPVIVM